jgi:hypothetical protein
MATNQQLAVIAVDAAYTSKWGSGRWLAPLQQLFTETSGHHAAALVMADAGSTPSTATGRV